MAIDGLLNDVAGSIIGVFLATERGGGGVASEAEDASGDAGPMFCFCFHGFPIYFLCSAGLGRREGVEEMKNVLTANGHELTRTDIEVLKPVFSCAI